MKTDNGTNIVQYQVGKNLRLVALVKCVEALACRYALVYILYIQSFLHCSISCMAPVKHIEVHARR